MLIFNGHVFILIHVSYIRLVQFVQSGAAGYKGGSKGSWLVGGREGGAYVKKVKMTPAIQNLTLKYAPKLPK